jgi:hypothetical protein
MQVKTNKVKPEQGKISEDVSKSYPKTQTIANQKINASG